MVHICSLWQGDLQGTMPMVYQEEKQKSLHSSELHGRNNALFDSVSQRTNTALPHSRWPSTNV